VLLCTTGLLQSINTVTSIARTWQGWGSVMISDSRRAWRTRPRALVCSQWAILPAGYLVKHSKVLQHTVEQAGRQAGSLLSAAQDGKLAVGASAATLTTNNTECERLKRNCSVKGGLSG
jgi:hypothetical protein